MTRVGILLCTVALLVGACGSPQNARSAQRSGRLRVVASFALLAEIALRVGGDALTVETLVPPQDEPHDYELTIAQRERLQRADVVLYLGNDFQPAIDAVRRGLPGTVATIDAAAGVRRVGDDPHVWLDPKNVMTMVRSTASALGKLAPTYARNMRARAAEYVAQLTSLDERITKGLQRCVSRSFVTGHAAFGYFARRYGLHQDSIAGLDPEAEPSAQHLEQLVKSAKQSRASVVFVESNFPEQLGRTLADEIGVGIAPLNTVETMSQTQIDRGTGYIELQRQNLGELRRALECV